MIRKDRKLKSKRLKFVSMDIAAKFNFVDEDECEYLMQLVLKEVQKNSDRSNGKLMYEGTPVVWSREKSATSDADRIVVR